MQLEEFKKKANQAIIELRAAKPEETTIVHMTMQTVYAQPQ